MARQAPDPTARIALLKAARAKLVKSKIKGPVNADEMAKIAGMTWRNLKPQVEEDADWPCLMRGSEGVAYQFDPKKVLDHMVKRLEAKLQERHDRSARLAKIAGFPEELAQTGLSIEELRHLDALQVSVQRRKIEQRNFVPLAEFEAVIADVFSTMQAETLSLVGRLDPSGRWPATVRADVKDELRSLLVRLHDKLGARFNPDAVRTSRAGTAGRSRRGARAARR